MIASRTSMNTLYLFVVAIHLSLALAMNFSHVKATMPIPGLEFEVDFQDGDLNLGVFVAGHYVRRDSLCGGRFRHSGPQQAEVARFAIDRINQRLDILPNITLGFVTVDTCGRDLTALARATYFLPSTSCWEDNEKRTVDDAGRITFVPDVIGALGVETSRIAVMVGSLFSVFNIPLLSTLASSDDLSDKSRFEYFMRLVPPDAYQSRAIINVVKHFNWTYISLLYSEGSYGENGGDRIQKLAEENGICLAYCHRIPSDADETDFLDIVQTMEANKKARAVVLFMEFDHCDLLFQAIEDSGLTGWFVWLISDTMMFALELRYQHIALGSLFVGFPVGEVSGFESYYRSLTLQNATSYWFPELWRSSFECSWNITFGRNSCHHHLSLGEAVDDDIDPTLSKTVDGIMVYALALQNLIHDRCPQALRGAKTHVRECVDGPTLLQYIKNLIMPTDHGEIRFDDRGDMLGKYWLQTVSLDPSGVYTLPVVGEWNSFTDTLQLDESILEFHRFLDAQEDDGIFVVESSCSKPCKPREYYQQLDKPCCWECRSCRENERISQNGTSCEKCLDFTWPDFANGTSCSPIEASNLKQDDITAVVLVIFGAFGVLLSACTAIFFVVYRHKKLLKATFRELSFIVIAGTCLASISIFTFVLRPDSSVCILRRVGFHLSVNLIYAPLLLKTTHIFRNFAAGKKGIIKPRFISSRAQLVNVSMLVVTQILILTVCEILVLTRPTMLFPVLTVRYVELTCRGPLLGFLLPLCFNISCILLCAVCGFLTRGLPENFNESWFIFVSVSTTLFTWVIILPTYFTSFYAYYQAALLAVCLVLNIYVTLGCQFAPKMYAVVLIQEEKLQLTQKELRIEPSLQHRVQGNPTHTTA